MNKMNIILLCASLKYGALEDKISERCLEERLYITFCELFSRFTRALFTPQQGALNPVGETFFY